MGRLASRQAQGLALNFSVEISPFFIYACMWLSFFFFQIHNLFSSMVLGESGGEEPKMSLIKYHHSLLLKVIHSQ